MKKFYILIILVFALLGCNKTEKAEIILSASNIEISSGGETLEFIVSSNVDWTSSKTGDIDFTFSPINGKAGETKVTIIAQKNLSSNDRNSTINLSGSGASASLSILQPNLIFNISPNLLEMDKNAETKTVNIQSNVSWEIENTNFPDWINSISPLQGENNGIISVSVNNSTNRKDKSTYILNIKYGDTYSYLNIYQDPAENHPPTKPTGLIPNLSYSNVSVLPQFSWDASSDSDGDTIEYIEIGRAHV